MNILCLWETPSLYTLLSHKLTVCFQLSKVDNAFYGIIIIFEEMTMKLKVFSTFLHLKSVWGTTESCFIFAFLPCKFHNMSELYTNNIEKCNKIWTQSPENFFILHKENSLIYYDNILFWYISSMHIFPG